MYIFLFTVLNAVNYNVIYTKTSAVSLVQSFTFIFVCGSIWNHSWLTLIGFFFSVVEIQTISSNQFLMKQRLLKDFFPYTDMQTWNFLMQVHVKSWICEIVEKKKTEGKWFTWNRIIELHKKQIYLSLLHCWYCFKKENMSIYWIYILDIDSDVSLFVWIVWLSTTRWRQKSIRNRC